MVGSSGEPVLAPADALVARVDQLWWTVPCVTCARLAARLPAAVRSLPTPSGWNPMHQHPPHTPLFASTSAAKSSHVSGSSGRVVYVGSTTVMTPRSRTPPTAGRRGSLDQLLRPQDHGEGKPFRLLGPGFGGVDHQPHVVGRDEEHVTVEGDRADEGVVDDLLLRLVEVGFATVTLPQLDEPGMYADSSRTIRRSPRSAG